MKMLNNIRKTDPVFPDPDIIREAGDIIKKGGLIIFPTQSLYGTGVNPFDTEAVDRIFQIKERSADKPILLLISHQKELENLVKNISSAALAVMNKFWPGNVTILFEAKDILPMNLTGGTGKIGLRLCIHPVASALIKAAESPITGTSANLSGNPGCSDISKLDMKIAENADLIIDAGTLKGGTGSTIVDLTADFPVILREGIIPAKDISALFR